MARLQPTTEKRDEPDDVPGPSPSAGPRHDDARGDRHCGICGWGGEDLSPSSGCSKAQR